MKWTSELSLVRPHLSVILNNVKDLLLNQAEADPSQSLRMTTCRRQQVSLWPRIAWEGQGGLVNGVWLWKILAEYWSRQIDNAQSCNPGTTILIKVVGRFKQSGTGFCLCRSRVIIIMRWTIKVTAPSGTGTSTASFTIIGPPTITSFTPVSGVYGATVTITGTNLGSATSVTFNGVAATIVTNLQGCTG